MQEEPLKFEGFIEVLPGIYYCETTGRPYSTRGRKTYGNYYYKTLQELTSKTSWGYRDIKYNSKRLKWHRIVYQFFKGPIPKNKQIDHKDRNRDNNLISNLRLATCSENLRNSSIRSNNKTGVTGVSFCKRKKKYHCKIRFNYTIKHLGYFNTIEEAAAVRKAAEIQYFGRFRAK